MNGDAMGVFETVNTSLGDLISAGGGAEASTFKITAKGDGSLSAISPKVTPRTRRR